MHAPVARPAFLGLLLTQGQLLPGADRRQALAGEPLPGEVVLHRLCACGAACNIVLDRSSAVAMTLELRPHTRVVTQPLEVLVEDAARRLIEIVAVVVEVHVLQGTPLAGSEALPRTIEASTPPSQVFLPDALLTDLLLRGRPLLLAGAEGNQGTERQHPAPAPPRPRHTRARGLTRIATTTLATYHRHHRGSIVSGCVRRDRRARAYGRRPATTRR